MKGFLLVGRGPAIAVVAALLAAGYAAASHPDFLRNYRFIPSRSTLVVNGSSWGAFEETYHARGTFGLVTGFEEGHTCTSNVCLPTHEPYARFVGVDAWLIPDSPLAYVLNLDATLNLSGLEGTYQPTAPQRLFFEGNDGQGRPFHLEATLHDRLIHLVGESGPGCCDVDHYFFNAVAYLKPHADFNLDGTVDAADYIALRKAASVSDLGAGSGAMTGSDYDLWRAGFGEVTDFSVLAEGGSSAVPEPASLVLLVAAGFFVAVAARARGL